MSTIQKRLTFVAGVAVLALLLGFSASAQGQGKSAKVPYGFTFNLCNGEGIETTGNANIVYNFRQDENGCIKVNYHFNTQNVRGVGLVSGDEYRIIDVGGSKVADVTLCDGCTIDVDIVGTWKVIAKDGTSLTLHNLVTLHIDVCTNEFSIVEKRFSIDCK